MKSRNVFLTVALLSVFALQPPTVRGQDPSMGGEDPMEIYRKAGIDQEQEVRIRQCAREFEEQARVKRKMLFELMQQMQQISLQPEPDENAVMTKQGEINKVNSEMANERIKLLLKIRSVLTKEQKEKLVGLMREAYARRPQ